MQLFVRLALLLGLAAEAAGAIVGAPMVVKVGGTPLRLPEPAGFVRYDGKSGEVDQIGSNLSPSSNRILAAFGQASDLEEVARSGFPELTRHFAAQANRSAENVTFTAEAFAELQKALHAQIDGLQNKTLPHFAVTEAMACSVLSERLKSHVDVRLKLGASFPLGVLAETRDSTSFSIMVKYAASGAALQEPVELTTVVGTCAMRVRDRLIYLYATSAYYDASDTEWVQQQLKSWRDDVLAANAPGVVFAEPEPVGAMLPSRWTMQAVLRERWVLIGGILGGVIAASILVVAIRHPRRKVW